jgi:hypothetical protein|tara:strand:+ start:2534 stop:2866 length:333 start_codon:yes stop_codon:yes gene_type:complete
MIPIGYLDRSLLHKKPGQNLEEFTLAVEAVLESVGAEIVSDNGDDYRVYQIPEHGAILGQFGDPTPFLTKKGKINANASIGYMGLKAETVDKIRSAFAEAGYDEKSESLF